MTGNSNLVELYIYNVKYDECYSTKIYKKYINILIGWLSWSFNILDKQVDEKALRVIIEDEIIKSKINTTVKDIIKYIKRTSNYYIQSELSKNRDIVILREYDNGNKKFYAHFNEKDFKQFIVFLMKDYKINLKTAYRLYRNGIDKRECAITLKDLVSDSEDYISAMKSLYKKDKEELEKDMFDDLFYSRYRDYSLNKVGIKVKEQINETDKSRIK